MEPPFAHHRLAAALAGQEIGHTIVFHAETSSTNDEARRLAEEGHPHGVVVCADHQTAGRGRRGAEWFSPPRRNLLLSVLLRPAAPAALWTRLTHLAALAVAEAVESACPGQAAQIKWPNDIYLSGRKVAGLLLESVFPASRPPFAVLGLGLNVNLAFRELPPELRAVTTSLAIESGGPVSREAVAAAFLRALGRRAGQVEGDFAGPLKELRRRSWLLGKNIRALAGGREVRGLAEGLGPGGELLVRVETGERLTLSSADGVRPLDAPAPR